MTMFFCSVIFEVPWMIVDMDQARLAFSCKPPLMILWTDLVVEALL